MSKGRAMPMAAARVRAPVIRGASDIAPIDCSSRRLVMAVDVVTAVDYRRADCALPFAPMSIDPYSGRARWIGVVAAVLMSALASGSQEPAAPPAQPGKSSPWAEWIEPDFPFFSSVLDA